MEMKNLRTGIRILLTGCICHVMEMTILAADLPLGSDAAGCAREAHLFVREVPAGQMLAVEMGVGQDHVTALTGADLSMTAKISQQPDCLLVTGVVEDTRATDDRAVDVVFRLPFQPAVWWSGISEAAVPDGGTKTSTRTSEDDLPAGAAVLEATKENGLTQDILPIGCVTDPKQRGGIALAIPPDFPCRFQFAYLPKEGCLELTLKFGLSSAAPAEFKSRAPFRFVIMPVDGCWGLRDAVRRYYAMFPDAFKRKTQSSGLWLFAIKSFDQVPDPENYAFWEAPRLNELPQALAHKIENYPYIIVGQRSFTHLKDQPSSYDEVLDALKKEPASSTKKAGWSWAEVKSFVETCGLQDAQGRWVYRARIADWGVHDSQLTFPLNPSPFLPGPTVASNVLADVATLLKETPGLSGIYVDSLASWGSFDNYRRDHFLAVRTPLSHDNKGLVCIPNWMPHVDFLRELRQKIGTNRLVFGNGLRPGRAFCGFECDVLGVETSTYDLQERSRLDFYRMIAGAKPFLFLFYLSTDIPRTMAEEYVQRFVAMGLSPEVKGRPWGCNKQRDADLLTKFLPIYRRLDLAGWQPVTYATVAPRTVWVERFGVKPPDLYFTVYNPDTNSVNVQLTIENGKLDLPTSTNLVELVEGRLVVPPQYKITVPAKSLRVLQWGVRQIPHDE